MRDESRSSVDRRRGRLAHGGILTGMLAVLLLFSTGCPYTVLLPGEALVFEQTAIESNCAVSDACANAVGVDFANFQVNVPGTVTITVTGASDESRPQVEVLPPFLPFVLENSGPDPTSNTVTVTFEPVWLNAIYQYKVCDCTGVVYGPYRVEILQAVE